MEEKTDLSNSVNNLKDEEKKINICLETQENRVNNLGLIWIFFIKLFLYLPIVIWRRIFLNPYQIFQMTRNVEREVE